MNKKNNILKVFSFVVVAFVLLLSVFTFIPHKENNLNFASADTVSDSYTFQGSNVFIPCWRDNVDYNVDTILYLNKFTVTPTGINFDLVGSRMLVTLNKNRYNYIFCDVYTNTARNRTTFTYPVSSYGNLYNQYLYVYSGDSGNVEYHTFYVKTNNSSFNGNIYRVDFLHEELVVDNGNLRHCNIIRYYDVNNNYLDLLFINYEGWQEQNNFIDRTYYLNQDLSDSQMYNQGYNDGLSANQDNIYNNGYRAGDVDGYNRGFDAGIVQGGNYTFNGLFSAIIDAPVKVFSGLLNFELLGVNLLGFITGLITLCLIVWIVKISTGGK